MNMTDYSMDDAPFRIGRVLSRSFSIYFRNIMPFGLLALAILAPTYVYQILVGAGEFAAPTNPTEYWSQLGAEPFVVGIAGFLLGNLVTAALVYGTVQDLKGRNVSFGECFAKGIALIFPVLGVAIVYLLVLALVAVITVVPGAIVIGLLLAATESTAIYVLGVVVILTPIIYVMIMLYVTVPVAVIERAGVGSLKRSAALTKGHRWRLFALLILFLAVAIALGMLLRLLGLAEGSANFVGNMVTQWVMSGLISAFSAVMAAVIYHDLRVAKEGVDTKQIAGVFD